MVGPMHLLGLDLGSSSVKASLLDAATGRVAGSGQYPEAEMAIDAPQPGWAEQDPAAWWDAAVKATRAAVDGAGIGKGDVEAVGIAYQMHGLVCLDAEGEVLRPSIIWCDSRAVEIGREAFESLGEGRCLSRLLNSPGNFTATKLAWVRRNEPDLYKDVATVCLPGDYLAARLTGKVATTVSGLSEGIFWDFQSGEPAGFLLDELGISRDMLAETVPTFGVQGELTAEAAEALGLKPGTPVTYRAGDQPNNALSLNVLEPGEVAATAGTSGVVYGVAGNARYDPQSRINTFVHVNHTPEAERLGLLLCINGTGITNAWVRRLLGGSTGYDEMNRLAAGVEPGSGGVTVLPFGNGSERMLGNASPGAALLGIDYNRHGPGHIVRAAQEGVAFAFAHGIDILRGTGVDASVIRAGRTNMFLSEPFRQTLADAAKVRIELYETDGAAGAARGAGIGAGLYKDAAEAFESLQRVGETGPDPATTQAVGDAFERWEKHLAATLAEAM